MPTPNPVNPRRKDERAYEAALRRGVLAPLMRSLRSGLHEAAGAAVALDLLERGFSKMPLSEAAWSEAVAAQARRLDGYHRSRLVQSFRAALGVDIRPVLSDDAIRPLMDAWRRENVSLIRTIPTRLHDGLYARMTETFSQRPFDQQALSKIIAEEGKSAGYNLRRLTRDQTSKAIGQLTQARHRQLGITEYTWRTAQDERVRDTHAALDGIRQRYDSPPSVGNPGDDIMCRCVAIPYIPEAETGVREPRGRRKGRIHYTRQGRPAARTPPDYTSNRHSRDREFRDEATLSEGTKAYIAVGAPSKMTGVDYRILNRTLREERIPDAAHQKMLLDTMDDMRPLGSDRIVYRRVPEIEDALSGEVIPLRSLLSTSMSNKATQTFGRGTIYQIRVPQGTPAIVTNAREREVLLPIGKRFHVVARTTDERGRIVLVGDLR